MTHTTKENRDVYYRKAKEEGYRARSAYKLLQIFEYYHILYPIIDEKSALSILMNSSCEDCKKQHNVSESDNDNLNNNNKLKSKNHIDSHFTSLFCSNIDSNSPCSHFDLNSNFESDINSHSHNDSHYDLYSDSDSDLTDYINVKRNCLSLGRIKNVVDLCSAPGSWSQLLRNMVYHDHITLKNACNKLKETKEVCNNLLEYVNIKPAIVAIDLQQMAPIDGVHFLKGDITDPKVLDQVRQLFLDNVSKNINQVLNNSTNRSKNNSTSSSINNSTYGSILSDQLRKNAQLITCDGAPDVSGLHETDSFLQSSLIKSALSVCLSLLDPDGYFICKTFFGSEDTPVFNEVCAFFDYCTIFKPPASRTSSFEHFIVAMGFRPIGHILINPLSLNKLSNNKSVKSNNINTNIDNELKNLELDRVKENGQVYRDTTDNEQGYRDTTDNEQGYRDTTDNEQGYRDTTDNEDGRSQQNLKENGDKEHVNINEYKKGTKQQNEEHKSDEYKNKLDVINNEHKHVDKDKINYYLSEIIKSIPQILSGDLSPYDKLPLPNLD